jgi:hypothetical protein
MIMSKYVGLFDDPPALDPMRYTYHDTFSLWQGNFLNRVPKSVYLWKGFDVYIYETPGFTNLLCSATNPDNFSHCFNLTDCADAGINAGSVVLYEIP